MWSWCRLRITYESPRKTAIGAFTEEIHRQLKECAKLMSQADEIMQKLAENLNVSEEEDLYW